MSDLPKGWIETKLGDILQLEYGKSLIKGVRNNNGDIPVLGSSGNIGYHDQFLVSGPVIIVGRKGDVGKIFFCDNNCWPIDTTYFIKVSNNLSINLIYHLLKSLKLNQYDKSTAIPGLNRNDIYKLKIKLPPLNEQHRIVAKLDTLFSHTRKAREELDRVPKLIARYKQAVLSAACSGQLTEDWREENTDVTQVEQKKRKNNNVNDLPKGWIQLCLKDVCVIARGGSPRPIQKYLTDDLGGINWIKISDATESDKYIFKTKQKITREGISRSRIVKDGDFILSNSMSFGRPYIVKTEGCIHDGWLVLSLIDKKLDQNYLYYFLSSQIAYNQFNDKAAGSTVRNLNIDLVKTVEILIPPLPEQQEIVRRVEQHFKTIDQMEEQYQKASKLLDRLEQATLSKAFRGELVPQDPNDIPASVLLEHILAERKDQPKNKGIKVKKTG